MFYLLQFLNEVFEKVYKTFKTRNLVNPTVSSGHQS